MRNDRSLYGLLVIVAFFAALVLATWQPIACSMQR